MKNSLTLLLVFISIILASTNLFSQITITDDGSGTEQQHGQMIIYIFLMDLYL